MATNNSEVSKVELLVNHNNVIRQYTRHVLNRAGMSWKVSITLEGSDSDSLYGNNGYLCLTAIHEHNRVYQHGHDFSNAKIEILNSNGIPVFSSIGKWFIGDVKWTRFCNWTYLSQSHNDLFTADGNFKAILSVGPLKYLTPAPSNVVAAITRDPRDHSPMESFKSLLDDGILTDVVVKTSTKTFPCHKVVLAAFSPVFKTMFEIEMKESTDNEVNLEGVFEETAVQDLLHYLYTKQTPPNIGNTCSTLFVAADYFQLPVLKAVCEEKLCTVIRVENAADFLQLAEKYNADALKKTSVKFIVSHYKDVMNTSGWKEIPETMTKYLLSTFLVTVAEKMKF